MAGKKERKAARQVQISREEAAARRAHNLRMWLTLAAIVAAAVLLNLILTLVNHRSIGSAIGETTTSGESLRESAEKGYDAYAIRLEEFLNAQDYEAVAQFATYYDLTESKTYEPYRLIFAMSLPYSEAAEICRQAALGNARPDGKDKLAEAYSAFYSLYDPETYTDENGEPYKIEEGRTVRARDNMDRDLQYMAVTILGMDKEDAALFAETEGDRLSEMIGEAYDEKLK